MAARASRTDLEPYAGLTGSPGGARLLAFARASMERYWSGAPAAVDTAGVPQWPGPPAGVYVSLLRGGETRACVGAPAPVRGSLAETVGALAVEVLRADRRRPPVRREELAGLRVVISFAHASETVASPMLVDPGREGLLVSSPRGHVAFLPGEALTIRWALREARRLGVLVDSRGDASFRRLRVATLAEPAQPSRVDEEDVDAVP